MLELKVWDGEQEVVLQFEHSLLSLSKWESKHKKAFLSRDAKSAEEMVDYFQDMLLSPEVDPSMVYALEASQLQEITEYIGESFTATTVPDDPSQKKFNPETMTSELIYYWLVALQIPFQPCESWNLSRLLMLVQVVSYKNQPPKKRPQKEVMQDYAAINEARKKMYGTTG